MIYSRDNMAAQHGESLSWAAQALVDGTVSTGQEEPDPVMPCTRHCLVSTPGIRFQFWIFPVGRLHDLHTSAER